MGCDRAAAWHGAGTFYREPVFAEFDFDAAGFEAVGDGGNLDVSAGYYRSRQNIDMDWVWNSYLQELRGGGNSALLDVISATSVNLSDNGLYAYGVPFWGNCCSRSYNAQYEIGAPYLSLAFSLGQIDIDASVRRDSGDATVQGPRFVTWNCSGVSRLGMAPYR